MATTNTAKVSNVGLSPSQQANVQNIVNSNPGGSAAYSKGLTGQGAATQDQLNTIAKGSGYSGAPLTSTGLPTTPGGQTPTAAVPNSAQPNLNPSLNSTPGQLPGQSALPTTTQGTDQGIPSNAPTPNAGQNTTGPDLSAQYKKAAQGLNGANVPSPDTQGSASAAIDQTMKSLAQPAYTPTPEIQTQVDDALSTYTKAVADYINPQNQRQSLVDEYQQMSDQLGIPTLKSELLDVNRIMNGTQDDIRSEITAAGGFATESQVQAMTIGRNKSLLKNSQFIQDQLTSAQNELGTMMNLSAQDRTYSEQKMQSSISLLGNVVQIQQSMKKATADNYNNIISKVGYSGLLAMTGSDPHAQSMVESNLGLPSGSLKTLGSIPDPQQEAAKVDLQLKQAQLNEVPLDRQLKQAQINSSNASTAKTVAETNALGTSGASLQPYLKTSYDGTQYVDLSSLGPKEKQAYALTASQNGLTPILDAQSASKLNAISVSKENLQNIVNSLNSSNLLDSNKFSFQKGIENSIGGFLGNSDVKSFNSWRTAVINNVQALAGGQGSGLRINQAEIDSALKNDLPVITGPNADTPDSASKKIGNLESQLNTWSKQLLGGGNQQSQNTQQSVIPSTQIPEGYYQASDGLLYKK